MPKLNIEYNEEDIKKLVQKDLSVNFNIDLDIKDIHFKVKSRNNYREQEWEHGRLKVSIDK